MASQYLLVLLLTLESWHSATGAGVVFNYNVSDTKYGPDGWNTEYPGCNGERQSPIDIVTAKAEYDGGLGKFNLETFYTVPSGTKFEAKNSGKGYVLTFAPNVFMVSGGGLPGTFTTLQFHFHWGSADNKGSEHTVDRIMYPAEVHFVNYNTKYPNISEALNHKDGLAVLGAIYKVGTEENEALTSFLKHAKDVIQRSARANLDMTHSLGSLLPKDTTAFYRYNGSLTTPTCNEVVTWTVFKNYVTITKEQLAMLRGLKYKVGNATADLTDTYRPVQLLHSRVVKRSYKDSGSSHVTGVMASIVSALIAAVLLMN